MLYRQLAQLMKTGPSCMIESIFRAELDGPLLRGLCVQHGVQPVERFQHMVLGRAYARLHDYHLAQDVAQEVFLDAYRALPGLREPAAFAAWLRTIAHKHIIDYSES